jgi:hypothetical protein
MRIAVPAGTMLVQVSLSKPGLMGGEPLRVPVAEPISVFAAGGDYVRSAVVWVVQPVHRRAGDDDPAGHVVGYQAEQRWQLRVREPGARYPQMRPGGLLGLAVIGQDAGSEKGLPGQLNYAGASLKYVKRSTATLSSSHQREYPLADLYQPADQKFQVGTTSINVEEALMRLGLLGGAATVDEIVPEARQAETSGSSSPWYSGGAAGDPLVLASAVSVIGDLVSLNRPVTTSRSSAASGPLAEDGLDQADGGPRSRHIFGVAQRDRQRPTRPQLVSQPVQAPLGEPVPPPGHRPLSHLQLSCDLLVTRALGALQHDPSPQAPPT